MGDLRKAVAVLLLIVFSYSLFSVYPPVVHAAVMPVNVYVDKFEGGKLDFHWDAAPGTTTVVLTYHAPVTGGNTATAMTTTLTQATNTASITGLKSDYIYDIDVKLYDQIPGAGVDPVGHGLLYYIPKITFYVTTPNQAYDDVQGGGREIGGKPKLQLKWIMPKVYRTSGVFDDANNSTVLSELQTALNAVYNDGRQISSLNFRVNISSDFTKLNSGSSQAAVLIDQAGAEYSAKVSGGSTTTSVSAIAVPGYQSFTLLGRSDPAADLPSAGANELSHGDIYPGSVYYMNIKPVFENASGQNVSVTSVGNPADQNGSLISGTLNYAYTSIRFQLSKDSANNIYVKIYKINQGSLDLPRLYYQVQSNDDPSKLGDWEIKGTMDDTYFPGDFAVTVISGVNVNNTMYYKIVVKSEGRDDRLESAKMPYTLSVDASRPPVPTNITVVKREIVYRTTTVEGISTIEKTTDVTLQWDKPANWDAMKTEAVTGSSINFYLAINTSQAEAMASPYPVLDAEGKSYGAFPLRYRVVAYVSAKGITEVGSKLQYTLKGFNLFKGGYWNGALLDSKPVIVPDDFSASVNAENYPNLLLPNKTYYLEMFSAKESDRVAILNSPNYFAEDYDKMSDRSIITSVTTLTSTEMDVPLPANFRLDKNNVLDYSAPPPAKVNNVELLFEKVAIKDWSNYTTNHNDADAVCYDIYMNTRTDTEFIKIGSTDDVINDDVAFTGVTDNLSSSIRVNISKFTLAKSPAARAAFGEYLRPNTTYYFYIKTRLHMVNTTERVSMRTVILPVTTVNITIIPPDDTLRKPLAPTDFAIAVDATGNQKLSGHSVTFNWLRQENDVKYELICTGEKVLPDDPPGTYSSDPIYQSFVAAFDKKADGVVNSRVYLDPAVNPPVDAGKFTYDTSTKLCTYTIDTWLFTNKLYYFSLHAVRKNTAATASVWASIPVTTNLIEAPQQLEVVSDAQLGFYWTDTDPLLVAEDFRIYLKGAADSDYKLVTRSQSTILKDKDGKTYYGRIMGLKLNSSYDVRAFKGSGAGTLVYEKRGMTTRDGYHEIMVKWKGLPSDQYSRFEIAVRSEDATKYTVLEDSDLEAYFDKDGQLLPYYAEETPQTVNDNYVYYYAKIKKSQVVLPGGLVIHQSLPSNMKYYIKTRTRKLDPSDQAAVAYSKYIGPVDSRTEFNQNDYDDTDLEEKEKAVFLDKMKELEKGLFWRLAVSNSTACKIFLKGDLISSAIKNSREDRVLIDISELNINIDADVIYMPSSVAKSLNSLNKSLVLRTSGAEFTLRPRSLDLEENQQIKSLQGKFGVKELYIALKVNRVQSMTGLPVGLQAISKINDFEVQAVPATRTEKELNELVNDKLYNKSSGLVTEKLNILANTYIGTGAEAAKILEDYTNQLVKMLETDLSNYLDSTVEASKISGSIQNISVFSTPVAAKLSCSSTQGFKAPYVLYDGTQSWQKLTSNITSAEGSLQFNTAKSGKYVILLSQASTGDIAADYWAKGSITKFMAKYDLSDIFPGVNTAFGPNNIVTCKEMVLLFEKVTGRTAENTGLDIKLKVKKLKLDNIINSNTVMKNITRQEAAGVLAELFAVKKSLDAASLRPGGSIYINDDAKIDDDLYNPVIIVVDKKVMSLDANGNFNPAGNMSRAEVTVTLVRLLEQTGDM